MRTKEDEDEDEDDENGHEVQRHWTGNQVQGESYAYKRGFVPFSQFPRCIDRGTSQMLIHHHLTPIRAFQLIDHRYQLNRNRLLSIDRRSPRVSTPDKPQPNALKGSELKAQLEQVQDDLKKSKERLAAAEKEKEKALEELKEAKKLADEPNEKLGEALVAQKRAEESSEIEKFRADELEQVGIEAAQNKEEEWQKGIETVRNQHAMDVADLLFTTQELQ